MAKTIPAKHMLAAIGAVRPEYALKHVAVAYLRAFDAATNLDALHPCEHGHLDCSARKNGPCYDEILANFPELAD